MKLYGVFLAFSFLWNIVEAKTTVLVSIAPQKFLVEAIGEEDVVVQVIVPPGANSHTYEPTSKQILQMQGGKVWFRIGESFESHMIPTLQASTLIIDQRDGLPLLMEGTGCCHKDAYDPHIWLSPRLLKQMAEQISLTLSEMHPAKKERYRENLSCLHQKLSLLDTECKHLSEMKQNTYILVSHPAFGYFCQDYGLQQLSIEHEGSEPTTRYLTDLIERGKRYGIRQVFLQKQHNPKGGEKIAKALGATTCFIDPYEENVIENIRFFAKLFFSCAPCPSSP